MLCYCSVQFNRLHALRRWASDWSLDCAFQHITVLVFDSGHLCALLFVQFATLCFTGARTATSLIGIFRSTIAAATLCVAGLIIGTRFGIAINTWLFRTRFVPASAVATWFVSATFALLILALLTVA